MKKVSLILLSVISLAVLSSCNKEDKLNKCVSQEESIEKYIQSKYADATVVITDTGISRIITVNGSGAQAQPGDSVAFEYKGYTFSNGPSNQFVEGFYRSKLGDKSLISGLDEGIAGMNKGEEAWIIFSARYGFFDEAVGAISPLTPLMYYVKLDEIYR